MKKLLIGLILLSTLNLRAGEGCNTPQNPILCGYCPGGCTYWVVCGLNTGGISLCDGTSPGRSYNPGVQDDPNSKVYYGPMPELCDAWATFSGTCCGGARSGCADFTPILVAELVGNC
jgi:hypothetical protein